MHKKSFLKKRERPLKAFCMALIMLVTSVLCYTASITQSKAADTDFTIHDSGGITCFRQNYKTGVDRDWYITFFRTSTGEVAYCTEYEYSGPSALGMPYYDSNGNYLSDAAKEGIEIILSYGYLGYGDEDIFTEYNIDEEEAEAATSVAIKKYLAAIGEENSGYSWSMQDKIYAMPGYEEVYDAMNWLYAKALNGEKKENPDAINVSYIGNETEEKRITHRFTVNTNNFEAEISGLTEGSYESFINSNEITVICDIPSNIYNKLKVQVRGNVPESKYNIGYYMPSNGSYQLMVTGRSGQFYNEDKIYVAAMGDYYSEEHYDKSGVLNIIKTDSSDGTGLTAAVFGIYVDPDCESLLTSIVTGYNTETRDFDNNLSGKGYMELPVGTYYVREDIAPVGYKIDDPTTKEVNIEADKTLTLSFTDTKSNTDIKFTKFCKNTGKTLPGAKFALYDVNNASALSGLDNTVMDEKGFTEFDYGLIEMTEKISSGELQYDLDEFGFIDTIISDDNGQCTIEENMLKERDFHTIVIKEIEAPDGYLIDDSIMYLTSTPSADMGAAVWEVKTPFEFDGVWLDWSMPGTIEISKTDQNETPVKGAVFGIYEDEACTTAAHTLLNYPNEYNTILTGSNGAVYYNSENATITTDGSGYGLSGYLMEGIYYIKEISVPEGYVSNDEVFVIKIGGADGNAAINVVNEKIYGTIALHKTDSENPNIDVQGAVYGLYKDNTLLSSFPPTNEYGTTRLTNIEPGTYAVKEISAPENYEIDTAAHQVTLSVDKGSNNALITCEVSDIKKVDPMPVSVSKVDENGTDLCGAFLQVLDMTGNIVDEWVTDGTSHTVQNVTGGCSYTLHEASAPEGYELADDIKFTVPFMTEEITKNFSFLQGNAKGVYSVVMRDRHKDVEKKYTTNIIKVDESGNRIAGAKLQILDSLGNIVEEYVTTENIYIAQNLTAGSSYTLHELQAPEGYELAQDIQFVAASTEDKTVQMTDISKKELTPVVNIYKLDENKDPVTGAKLGVYDTDGNEIETWETDGSCHTLRNLLQDKTYILREIKTPKGFETAQDITFNVKSESFDIVMTDNHTVEIVQTGDYNTNMRILSLIFVMVAAGFGIFGLCSWKRNYV